MKISADDLFPYNFDNVLRDILEHKHTYYVFKGGRGSCKSSFVSIVIILLMTRKENRDKHCIIFRKTANTLRDSVFHRCNLLYQHCILMVILNVLSAQ